MDRNQAKEFYPILQAFAEGKTIETRRKPTADNNGVTKDGWYEFNYWTEMKELEYRVNVEYRIKPEPKYRPFKSAKECWIEMLKHQPFGVVKDKYYAKFQVHRSFTTLLVNGCNFSGYEDSTFLNNFNNLLFADGTPFGIKEEE